MRVLFDMPVALFERAHLVAHEPQMNGTGLRRWNPWDGCLRERCRRDDFLDALPLLRRGEDAGLQSPVERVAAEERGAPAIANPPTPKEPKP